MVSNDRTGVVIAIILGHSRRTLAEEALNHFDIKVAEHAFVKIHDYYGLQFLRRLQQFQVDQNRKNVRHLLPVPGRTIQTSGDHCFSQT